jgi:putative Mg2+ transporter-C (MgtC) family protein
VNTVPWWIESWVTIQGEFSDIPDVAELTRLCLRLLVAVVLGGILGYERERSGAAAGFRTHMLVALGSALFVLVPLQAGTDISDLSRVLQGVIAGIGFLGAGAILKSSDDQEIRGLTTAASIWLTAAVGIAAGMGREATAVLSTLFALLILLALRIPLRKAIKVELKALKADVSVEKEGEKNH